MKKRIVIKLSGQVFSMDQTKVLKDYATFFVKKSKTHQPIIVAGGGKIARYFISHARSSGADESTLDELGIEISRLNAKLLIYALKGKAYPHPPTTLTEVKNAVDSGLIVVEKDMEQKTELVKNLISNARIILTMDAKESEFRVDLTKTDFKILEQLLKNPKEKIDVIAKSTKLSTKTVTRTIEKFETNPAVQFTIIYDPKKLEKFIAFALIAMVQSDIKKIKDEIETSFGDYFWQVPVTAKELLVLFMYSDNIYNADVMRHKIKEIDGVAFTEVFFPKKITMPTNWISNSIKNASRSERLHVPIKQINR